MVCVTLTFLELISIFDRSSLELSCLGQLKVYAVVLKCCLSPVIDFDNDMKLKLSTCNLSRIYFPQSYPCKK